MGKSLQNGTLFDSMRWREEREADVSAVWLKEIGRAEKKRKKEFAEGRKRWYIDFPWSSKVKFFEFVVKWNAKVNFFGSNDSKYFLAGSNRLNSTTESLILAQDERWRRA